MNSDIRVEWFHHIFRHKRFVYCGVLVLSKSGQRVLANVDHDGALDGVSVQAQVL